MASSRKLESASDKLRARTIGWEGYSRAGDLTQEQLQLVNKISKQPKQTSDTTLSNESGTYIPLLVKLLGSMNRTDALQWCLVMLGDVIIGKDESQAQAVISANPWDALLRHLDSQDEFCQLKTASLVSLLLPSDPSAPAKVSSKLTRSLGSILRQSSENQDIALQCLGEVLRSHETRTLVWNTETSEKGKTQSGKIIESLVNILKELGNGSGPASPQTQYQVAFCFWLFSFEKVINEKIESHFGIIPLLSEVARRASKEKVVRVILSTFRNMLTLAPEENKSALLMASSGMLTFTQSLIASKRFFGDDEVREDSEWLRDYLKAASRELTTWDEYLAEIESKRLTWTPPHTDDEFWHDNATKFSGNDYAALKKLLLLLDTPSSETGAALTQAIACNDLSMFMRYNTSTGKRDVMRLGGKEKVLKVLNENADQETRYKALVVVQMLVSQSWMA